MAIYALGDQVPTLGENVWVHPDAVVIGDVTLGDGVSVWPSAVLRGDYGSIEVGAMSNIQDGATIHSETEEAPTVFGKGCVIGHNAHVAGAVVGDGALISSGAIVLENARVGAGAVVAAGCLVPPWFELPARQMALGVPAKIREGYEVPKNFNDDNISWYSRNSIYYRNNLRRLD